MNTNLKHLESRLRESLSEEDARYFDELKEQSLFNMISGLFKDKLAWIMVLLVIANVAVFILLVYAVVQIFSSTDLVIVVRWLTIAILSMLAIVMIKLVVWMQMYRNALLREILRLQVLVHSLKGELDD